MSSAGSRSDSDHDVDEELALRIALERSKVDTRGSSVYAPSPLPRRCRFDAGAGPSVPAQVRKDGAVRVTPTSSPALAGRCSLRATVGASARPACSDAHVGIGGAHRPRERWQARERDAAEQSVCRRRGLSDEPNEDERLLAWVYSRSLTTAETDGRHLLRKNVKALALPFSSRSARRLGWPS
jgi:hypothetical protein